MRQRQDLFLIISHISFVILQSNEENFMFVDLGYFQVDHIVMSYKLKIKMHNLSSKLVDSRNSISLAVNLVFMRRAGL